MQRIRAEITRTVLTPPVAAILCLTFLTWYVAELSNGFFADLSFSISLALAVAVGLCALCLARDLEREKARRRTAEARLHASTSDPQMNPEQHRIPPYWCPPTAPASGG